MGTVEYDKIELTPEEIQEAILERKKKKYFHERNKKYWEAKGGGDDYPIVEYKKDESKWS